MKMKVREFADGDFRRKIEVGGIIATYNGRAIADAEYDEDMGWAFYDFNNDYIDGINYDNINGDTELDVFQIGEFNG